MRDWGGFPDGNDGGAGCELSTSSLLTEESPPSSSLIHLVVLSLDSERLQSLKSEVKSKASNTSSPSCALSIVDAEEITVPADRTQSLKWVTVFVPLSCRVRLNNSSRAWSLTSRFVARREMSSWIASVLLRISAVSPLIVIWLKLHRELVSIRLDSMLSHAVNGYVPYLLTRSPSVMTAVVRPYTPGPPA